MAEKEDVNKTEEKEKKEVPVSVDDKRFADVISTIESLSVVELADLVKALEEKFGVSAVAPVAVAGVAASEEEKSEVNIVLKEVGDQKINVIKATKEITGLGLKESKELVDSAPKPLKEGVKREEAEEMKKKLEEVGATVELE